MTKIILFNKPYDVLSQFTDKGLAGSTRKTLSEFIDVKDVYAAGRLDKDSEGLLVLTDNGRLQSKISDPKYKTSKTYWVQVEDEPDGLWPRTPPVRFRKTVADSWLEITITEGRNRQVRRMTAAVNCPTLRLIRYRVGEWTIDGIENGAWQEG